MQKCCCAYLHRFLIPLKADKGSYQHLPAYMVDRKEKDLFIGISRNPFDWYPSLYFYKKKYNHISTHNRTFPQFVEYIIQEPKILYHSHESQKFNPQWQSCKKGGMAFMVQQMFYDQGKCLIDHWLSVEGFTEQLSSMLDRPMSDERINNTERPPNAEIYDYPTIRLIQQNDAEYLEQFNYAWSEV